MSVKAEHVEGDRYRVRVYVGRSPSGRQIQRSRYFRATGQRQADKQAAKIEGALRDELAVETKRRGTVGWLVDEWVKHRRQVGASPATLKRNVSITREIKAKLGHHQLDALTAKHVDAFYAALRAENIARPTKAKPNPEPRYRSESTIHHYHRVLASILRQGERWEEVHRIATRNATIPSRDRVEPHAPPSAVVNLLMEKASPEMRAAIRLLAATGLRRGELVGLRWPDLHGHVLTVSRSIAEAGKGQVLVKTTKTGRVRTMTIDDATLATLEIHWEKSLKRAATIPAELDPAGWIFPNITGDPNDPRSPGWLSLAWRRLCAKHGAKVRLHDLRHYHATTLIDQGIPITTVAQRLGHAQTSTTLNVYAHAVAGSDAAAADVIQRALTA